MSSFAGVSATAMMVVLVVVLPWRGARQYRRLQAAATDPAARMRLYLRSTLVKWALVPLLAVVAWAAADQGFVFVTGGDAPLAALPLLALVVLSGVVLHRLGRTAEGRAEVADAASNVAAILPRTPVERRMFVLVAVTAGVVEELAYRFFLLNYLAWVLPGVSPYILLVPASVVFGLVHVYQGARGVILTGVLGLVLGAAYLVAGLLPAIVLHTLIDLRVLLIPVSAVPAPGGPDHPGDAPGDGAGPGPIG